MENRVIQILDPPLLTLGPRSTRSWIGARRLVIRTLQQRTCP